MDDINRRSLGDSKESVGLFMSNLNDILVEDKRQGLDNVGCRIEMSRAFHDKFVQWHNYTPKTSKSSVADDFQKEVKKIEERCEMSLVSMPVDILEDVDGYVAYFVRESK